LDQTTNLGLNKYDADTDGSSTFNIDTGLNGNWDIVDAAVGKLADLTTDDAASLVAAVNEHETQINDLATYGGCLAKLSTNQSISTAAETKISFNSIERESKYTFWSSSYPTRLTIPEGVSRVRLVAQAAWIDSEVGIRTIRIGKNDGNVNSPRPLALAAARNNPLVSGLSTPLQTFINEFAVTEGDYFELLVYQNSGSALSVSSTGAVTYLALEVIE
jgi:hypothetical protein